MNLPEFQNEGRNDMDESVRAAPRPTRPRPILNSLALALTRRAGPLVTGVLVGVLLCFAVTGHSGGARVDAAAAPTGEELSALRAEIEHIKTLIPDQAHAMKDVSYHFASLWFAAENKNWPLADFYLAEARSHLKWAVCIRPVRQTQAGDVDLNGILEALDNSLLSAVKEAIDKQDSETFGQAYRQAIEGCYSCHKASEKPFLRPHVPTTPTVHILNLDPTADWPQ
jgi:hypothetical protein